MEIDQGLSRAHSLGMGVVLVTATLRHHNGDDPVSRLSAVGRFLRMCLHGAGWDRRKARLGYVGAIKTVEVTWGPVNGWHPHTHPVLIFERPLTEEERADLETWLLGRWAGICERYGFGTINEHGVKVDLVTDPGAVGEYVVNSWSIGMEMTRGDLKSGATVPAVALLADFAATGDLASLNLWREYEAATFGRRAVVWSPGLRALLLGDEVEVSDEEAAASEGIDLALVRWLVRSDSWNARARRGEVGELLTQLEEAAGVALGLCTMAGHDPPPLSPERTSGEQAA